MESGRFIGVTSGTSPDGVDVVLVTIDEHRVIQLTSLSWPTPMSLKQAVLDICQGQQFTPSQFGQLGTRLGQLFADAANTLLKEQDLQVRDIVAIGCHGQAIWHEPTGVTPRISQIGDNNQIVACIRITVTGDFRHRNIALGGQGVPLVPTFHHALLAHPTEQRMMPNTSSIANLSLPVPGQPVGGYDIGPGNILMDTWIWRQADEPHDKDTEWAWAGKVIFPLLQNMLNDPYFSRPAPKSTGCEYFNYDWLEHHLRHFPGGDPRDVQAILVEPTAVTTSEQVLLSGGCERLMVCGGGSRNPLLMACLAALLLDIEVTTADAVGVSDDDMETSAFAWLAWRVSTGLPENLSSVTGASQETVPRAIFPTNP